MNKSEEQLNADRDAVEQAHGKPSDEWALRAAVGQAERWEKRQEFIAANPNNFTDWAAFEKEVREPPTEQQIRNRVYLESRVQELSADLIRANAAKGRWIAVTICLAAACILETWYILGLPPK